MADICRDGGESAYQEYTEGEDYIGLVDEDKLKQNRDKFCQSIPNTLAFLNNILTNCREPFIYVSRDYINFMFAEKYYCTILDSKSGKHCDEVLDEKINLGWGNNHYKQPFGIPYREWDPSLCDNSCIADLYPAIREFFTYQEKYNAGGWGFNLQKELYTNYTDNPANCCGTDDGSLGADTKCQPDISFIKTPVPLIFGNSDTNVNTDESNSDESIKISSKINDIDINSSATTFSAQITLLSFILCIIFALFK